ncbi:MAG: hypothetical protein MUE72_06660 [Chitinophagaceae bacterium]|jgi:hypothetical protein|nr:hypothetical protein [Chitinophagaceae bacterium]
MQNSSFILWIAVAILLLLIILLDKKYYLLRDISTAKQKTYSYARVQLSWWTIIIIASFIAIFITKGNLPILDSSLIILLGISSGTTGVASIIDVSDRSTENAVLIQNGESENFFLDILSDANGISIHRLQAFLFNLVIGIWVLVMVAKGLTSCTTQTCINTILPIIDPNKLLLLGVSAATYAGLKTNENKK